MATTYFIDGSTPIVAAWLNDVNGATYNGTAVYTPAGTNAVATTVQAKLRQTVSVKDFGAVGDGITDDTAALQAALNAGVSLLFPDGVYKTTAQLTMSAKSNILLKGDNATIYTTANGDVTKYILFVSGCSFITVQGIKFQTNGTLLDNYPTDSGGITNATNGIRFDSTTDSEITNCYFYRVNTAIEARYGSDRCSISNNQIFEVGRKGIGIYDTQFTNLVNNIINYVSGDYGNKKFSDGIYYTSSTDSICSDNNIYDVRRIGVVVEGDGVNLCKNIQISNNRIDYAHGSLSTELNAGVWIEPTKSDGTVVVQGNHITRSDLYGILLNPGFALDNYVADCTYGIDANSPSEMVVKGNYITGCSISGIRIRTSGKAVVDGNTCKLNTGNGAFLNPNTGYGNALITNNVFIDNTLSGLFIKQDGGATTKTNLIAGNRFFTSSTEASPASGQPYGIYFLKADAGGSAFSHLLANEFENNSFEFNGVFTSTYPSNLNIEPSAFKLENQAGAIFYRDFGNGWNGNKNSKYTNDVWLGYTNGELSGASTSFTVGSVSKAADSALSDLRLKSWSSGGASDEVIWSRHNSWFAPATDNARDLGGPSNRWNDVYATNATIQTSDANEKQDIDELSEAEKRVALAVKALLKKYRWKSAVAEKGNDARIHFGVIAQELKAAFESEGLDAGRYGVFINSIWWEVELVIPATNAKPEIVDSDGNVIQFYVPAHPERIVVETYKSKEDAPEGAIEKSKMGVRYSELFAFVISAI